MTVLPQAETLGLLIVDEVFVKSHRLPIKGMMVPQHVHRYPHISLCAGGAVRVEAKGLAPRTLYAGDMVTIAAGVSHLFTALADNTLVACIHNASRTGDVEIEAEHNLLVAV